MSKILKEVIYNNINKKIDNTNLPVNIKKSDIPKPLNNFEFLNFFKTRIEISGINPNDYTYTVFDSQIDNTILTLLINFINTNYNKPSDYYRQDYNKELLSHYISNDCIVVFFYKKNKLDVPIGCMLAKRIKIQVREKEQFTTHDFLEANFLCIIPELRSKNLIHYFNYIIVFEFMKRWNIYTAYFTGTKNLPWVNYFSYKKNYYRPINYNKLLETCFLPSIYSKPNLKKIYKTFSYQHSFKKSYRIIYINKKKSPFQKYTELNNINFIENICKKLYEYSENNYNIFQLHTADDINSMFNNADFHNFCLLNEKNEVEYFMNFFNVNFCNNTRNPIIFKNLHLYTCFFENNVNIPNVFEIIHQYMFEKDICDLCNVSNFFGYSDKEYYQMKFFKSPSNIYHYTVNFDLPQIPSIYNSLITI